MGEDVYELSDDHEERVRRLEEAGAIRPGTAALYRTIKGLVDFKTKLGQPATWTKSELEKWIAKQN